MMDSQKEKEDMHSSSEFHNSERNFLLHWNEQMLYSLKEQPTIMHYFKQEILVPNSKNTSSVSFLNSISISTVLQTFLRYSLGDLYLSSLRLRVLNLDLFSESKISYLI